MDLFERYVHNFWSVINELDKAGYTIRDVHTIVMRVNSVEVILKENARPRRLTDKPSGYEPFIESSNLSGVSTLE
jgi:hypothetical protein